MDQGEYSNFENLDLGALGDYDPYIDLYNLGFGNEIEIEVIESDSVDYLMGQVYLTVESLGK